MVQMPCDFRFRGESGVQAALVCAAAPSSLPRREGYRWQPQPVARVSNFRLYRARALATLPSDALRLAERTKLPHSLSCVPVLAELLCRSRTRTPAV